MALPRASPIQINSCLEFSGNEAIKFMTKNFFLKNGLLFFLPPKANARIGCYVKK